MKRPKKITFSNSQTVEYQYDAMDNKLREKDKSGIWTDYVGIKIYKNNVLYQIGMDEGRINAQGEYEYGIQDHLGNVRVMFRDSLSVAKITQTENFGVWGESLLKLNYYRAANNKQQFIYTGHERNEELGVYDAKARIYDPIVPRFWQIDILSDKFRKYSPYSYSLNNPLRFIDPNGMEVRSIAGGIEFTGADAGEAFSVFTGRKNNVYIDITADSKEQNATANTKYNSWAVFAISNFGIAREVLNIFKDKSLSNLVIEAHSIRHVKSGSFDGLKIKSDEGRGLSFNNEDIKSFNTDGANYSNAYAKNQVESLMGIMNKVKDGGNCIFAVCNLGTSQLGIGDLYAEQLSTLSGNRLNLFTINGLSSAWINSTKGSSNIGATVVSGTLNSSLNGAQPYWNRIGASGSIIQTYREIILSDSNNPVELK
ncbi:MAG: RHS repeat-associated core domain-containing protein [Arcicella sp.]|nr:RHS repeat-associated core domain-containing protein [Arcicella sp.]